MNLPSHQVSHLPLLAQSGALGMMTQAVGRAGGHIDRTAIALDPGQGHIPTTVRLGLIQEARVVARPDRDNPTLLLVPLAAANVHLAIEADLMIEGMSRSDPELTLLGERREMMRGHVILFLAIATDYRVLTWNHAHDIHIVHVGFRLLQASIPHQLTNVF